MELKSIIYHPIFSAVSEIILILIVALLMHRLLKYFIEKIAKKFVAKTKTEIDDLIIDFIEKFLFRIILIVALYFTGEALSDFSGERIFFYFRETLYVIVVFIVAALAVKLITLFISYYLGRVSKKRGSELEKDFGLLLKRFVQIALYLTAIITIFTHFNIDVKGLVATLGVGSLAIALAAQETLSNMIAGFVIMVDRPFRVGDRIRTPSGVVGEVFEIGLRSMKLLDFEKNLHIIPNSEIVKSEVINYSYPNPNVRVKIDVGVAYGSDLEKVKQIILEVCQSHPMVLKDPAPNVYFVNFGESSLDLTCVSYVEHYRNAWVTGDELRMNIYKALNENNIEIPFPQRVVHIQKER